MKSYAQRRSQLQEKRAARDIGGQVQKASGASDFAKGDARKFGELRLECKHTSKDRYRLKLFEIQKIKKEATRGGCEDWLMQIEFLGQAGQSEKYAVMDTNTYSTLKGITPQLALGSGGGTLLLCKDQLYGRPAASLHFMEAGVVYDFILCPWYLYNAMRATRNII